MTSEPLTVEELAREIVAVVLHAHHQRDYVTLTVKPEVIQPLLESWAESHSRQLWLEAPWEKLDCLFCDLAQLLDGWHQDGTAWSEWDESVRKRLSVIHQQIVTARQSPAPVKITAARVQQLERDFVATAREQAKYVDGLERETLTLRAELQQASPEQQIASLQSELAQLREQVKEQYDQKKAWEERSDTFEVANIYLRGAAAGLVRARSHTQACTFSGCTCGAAADFRDALADLSRELQVGGRYLRGTWPEEKQSNPKELSK